MISPKISEKRGFELKFAVFFMVITLAGVIYIDSAAAGGGGMAAKVQTDAQTAGMTKKEGPCPQPRTTAAGPASLAKARIPANADVKMGEKIFQKTAKPMACKMCHGVKGEGNGKLGKVLTPRPRNFTCSKTMQKVSPGQMFWIIKNGSKGTGMVAHGKSLTDKQIWDVVKYINTKFVQP